MFFKPLFFFLIFGNSRFCSDIDRKFMSFETNCLQQIFEFDAIFEVIRTEDFFENGRIALPFILNWRIGLNSDQVGIQPAFKIRMRFVKQRNLKHIDVFVGIKSLQPLELFFHHFVAGDGFVVNDIFD